MRMIPTRRHGGALALLAGSLTLVAAAPAAAGIDVFGAHDMRVGEHWILDGPGPFPETPAVVCHYGADDELERMTIREPVLFKYPGAPTGAQQVGWLARVEWSDDHSVTGPWQPDTSTSTSTGNATTTRPADLAPKVVTFPADVEEHAHYRVVYRLLLARAGRPRGEGVPPGRVVSGGPARAELMAIRQLWRRAHRGSRRPCAGRALRGGTAHRGAWPSLDPGQLRISAGAPRGDLRVRRGRPAGAAAGPATHRPRTQHRPRIDLQDVGWKAVVQTTFSTGPESWENLVQTPVVRKRTSDGTWAAFRGRTVEVPSADVGVAVRVVYRMYWYEGSSTSEANRAVHWPYWYALDSTITSNPRNDYCHSFLN